MKRENGYYWVKLSGSWIIAKWTCFEWHIAGTSGYALDDHFSEIDETPITREPIEQEQSEKKIIDRFSINKLVEIFKKVLSGNGKYMVEFDNENDNNDFILDLSNEFRSLLNSEMENSKEVNDSNSFVLHQEQSTEVFCVPMQLCPKCNGQGVVSKPPYVAGDVNEWTSSSISFPCDVCNGAKIIPMYQVQQPKE